MNHWKIYLIRLWRVGGESMRNERKFSYYGNLKNRKTTPWGYSKGNDQFSIFLP